MREIEEEEADKETKRQREVMGEKERLEEGMTERKRQDMLWSE